MSSSGPSQTGAVTNAPKRRDGTEGGTPYWDTRQAAAFLQLSPRTLERMRVEGCGPRFLKAGRGLRAKALYRPDDVQAWIEEISYGSTSEYER